MTQAQIIERAVQTAVTAAMKALNNGASPKAVAKGKATKWTDAEKQASVEAAFRRHKFPKGTAAPVANGNVLTYGVIKDDGSLTGWLAKGRRVNKGESAMKVGTLRLFHECQTHQMDETELKALAQEIVTKVNAAKAA